VSDPNLNSTVNSNILRRDGTSQSGREKATLAPKNHPLDDRSMKDLEQFVQGVAKMVNYYTKTEDTSDETGGEQASLIIDGTWDNLFSSKMPEEKQRPHLALMYAFLELWTKVQDHANTIPKRHLDFFYREFLQFTEKEAVPDKAHILFELAKNVKKYDLAANTELSAGKDDAGIERIYKTDREIVLNKTTATEFKTINNPYVTGPAADALKHELYASPIANSKDGIGEALDSDAPEWDTFGNKEVGGARQRELEDIDRTMPSAEIGFAIGSPILHLAEGDRTIRIKFNFSEDSSLAAVAEIDVQHLFTFGLSTEEEWLEPEVITGGTGIEGEAEEGNEGEEGEGSEGQDDPQEKEGQAEDFEEKEPPKGHFPDLPTVIGVEGKSLSFELFLDGTLPAVIPFNAKELDGEFVTKYPVLRAMLNTVYYQTFSNLKVESIELSVTVTGVRNLVIQSDLARLNPSKPFMPFGPKPKVNSNFYIGSEEVFYKRLSEVSINIDWGDLPESLVEYYRAFGKNCEAAPTEVSTLYNNSFKVNFKLFRDRKWLSPDKWANQDDGDIDSAIFATSENDVVPDGEKQIVMKFEDREDFEPIEITGDGPTYGIDTINGFLKMELQDFDFFGPESAGLTHSDWDFKKFVFGHREYAGVFAERSLNVAGVAGVARVGETGEEFPTKFPNQPYTPLINALYLDYEARIVIDSDNSDEEFFHIAPFGYNEEKFTKSTETGSEYFLTIVPSFTDEGTLYIGLSDFNPPQNISLLFQVVEGSADASSIAETTETDTVTTPAIDGALVASAVDIEAEKTEVQWRYLTKGNIWAKFQKTEIVADTTNGLKTSGIISFSIPKTASAETTVLPSGKHWLRASITNGAQSVGKMIAVTSQATLVEFSDQKNDPNHLKDALESGKIKKLKNKVSQIKSVTQPYASFGGKVTEQDDEFYTRVSERLRHKGRAETFWDYEHLVLENFAQIYKIKAVNHSNKEGLHEPGNVLLVGIPNIKNNNAVNVLEPRNSLNTLEEIEDFLATVAPRYVDIHVVNPIYEKIHLDFSVKFHAGYDVGFYQEKLQQSITKYLSPWAFDEGAEISFNNSIHKYAIMNFVEEQVYVNYVFNFKLFYTPAGSDIAILTSRVEPEDPRVILVSGNAHLIDVRLTDPPPLELEYCMMAIERNFIIKS
jgi:hypothetical protein